jgi:hypothetical protein
MTRTPPARLIAVDGIHGTAVRRAARESFERLDRARRGGISHWDASGVFDELRMADPLAGRPSARTLLLLYAADLAFRLRWQIRPTLAEGRSVVAAPYVATAVAFGLAAGLPSAWLSNLFRFAPRPAGRVVTRMLGRGRPDRLGFVEFACGQMAPAQPRTADEILDRARARLRVPASMPALKAR